MSKDTCLIVRMTSDEKLLLAEKAGNMTISRYVRSVLFDNCEEIVYTNPVSIPERIYKPAEDTDFVDVFGLKNVYTNGEVTLEYD